MIATRKPAGAAEPDVVIRLESWTHKVLTAVDEKPWETYPFDLEKPVECRDAAAVVNGLTAAWKAAHVETSAEAPAAKKTAGPARWMGSITGKAAAGGPTERCDVYAWAGKPFIVIYEGATFTAQVTYSETAAKDPRTTPQVVELLKALEQIPE